MRTTSALLALSVLAACRASPRPRLPPGEVALAIEGRVEDGPLDLRPADLARFPRLAIQAREPSTGRLARFEGVAVAELLARAVVPKRGVDVVVVRSRNGRQAMVPRARLRDLAPVLADRADGMPIAEWARQAGIEMESPLLAWPNLDQPGLDLDPRSPSWWAAGVVALVLEDWVRSYGRALRLPGEAGDEARRGAELTEVHCLPCHRVRGVGGARGPDLLKAVEGWPAERVAGVLAGHARQAWLPPDPEGEAARRRIAAFLAAMAVAPPLAPAEEAPGPELPPRPPPGHVVRPPR